MPDTVTPARRRSAATSSRSNGGNGGPSRQWSHQPHHRRRRTFAALAVVALFIVVLFVAGSGGGSSPHPLTIHTAGLLSRIQTLSGSGASSFAGVQTAAENAAIDRTLAYTPAIRVAGAQHREVALTFDDGPGPYTTQVVSVLNQLHVPATFFEVGTPEQYFSAGTRDIIASGYTIEDHTWSHAPMGQLSPTDQRNQLVSERNEIAKFGAPYPRLFRPPYGLWNSGTIALLRKYRMLMVLWTVDTSDYRLPGVDSIISSAVSGAQPGAIILMHDAGGDRAETVAALPKVVEDLRARGYKLVTVPQLILDNPPPANQQIASMQGGGG